MDDLDYRLLALLRADARRPVASLAAELDVSRATVRARIDRMVDSGVIAGFTVLLRKDLRPATVRAITMIEVEGRAAETVIARLHGFPEVRTVYTTNGRWDVVAEVETDSLEAFDDTLRRIRQIAGIASTETSILLSARKAVL
ncbi:Lrp/AsnC family transcriptional regulator [Azospirillum rugosum]|uniref:DNA-binding Lrp family transcriptional regulator n=1 Tax=Azospirillum rugosum TaxID=416170 RepID=A0ABS4SGY0_9PROT|nr:Lrp/AsnC family transcriptional regulator [Azospirillum rugosum]MBP2291762.1 DNA-binding Lrp family transcriptional regulator [Azospirillum rugosum]MDQ0524426.1 DNA-binding Lrp family transcriptional regulator [Azospirillum rugosum]